MEPRQMLWLRAAPTRNRAVSTTVLTTTVSSVMGHLYDDTVSPSTSVLAARVESTEMVRTARPAVRRRKRLLSRNEIGLGRLLRGTDHAILSAFCRACP